MDLKEILKNHRLWFSGKVGKRADLSGADLRDANLNGANLSCADLCSADLRDADLSGADLSGADLSGADLYGTNLYGTNLMGANLSGADLRDANLNGANLNGANLDGVNIAEFRMVPEIGEFTAFKSVYDPVHGRREVITVRIPATAKRVNAIGSRKCRASAIEVIDAPPGEFRSPTHTRKKEYYSLGKIIEVPDFCDDVRIECAPGIHFFMTRAEAEAW